MDAETCTSPAANVLESACGLYSYLSSGKSSAIAISFLPMSFHCSSTACDGLGAGFGGSFFAASCAITGNTANPMANARLASLIHFIMVSLLSFVPGRDAILIRRTTRQDVSRAMPRLGPPSYAITPGSHEIALGLAHDKLVPW